jgi:hypothetical protein
MSDELDAEWMLHLKEHPEDEEILSLWMADAEIAEMQDPEACARFAKLFPGLGG